MVETVVISVVAVTVVLGTVAVGGIVVILCRQRRRGEPRPRVEPKAPAGRAWNIPPAPEPAADRQPLLAQIGTALRAGTPTILQPAHGRAGLGTTTAMIEFARRRRGTYDVAWWIAAEDPQLIADRMARLAEILGLASPTDPAEQATAWLLDALRDRDRWLLVFDDAVGPRQLARFLPAGSGHVLVGSTDPDWSGHGTIVAVQPFVRAESVDLLQARRPDLTADEADQVAAALDDLPLAVDLAGGTLAASAMDVGCYLRRLSAHAMRARAGGDTDATAASASSSVAFDLLAAENPSGFALLTLAAWLGREPVPLALLTRHADQLPTPLAQTAQDPPQLAGTAATLHRRGLARLGPDGLQLHGVPAAQLMARTLDDRPDDRPWSAWAVRLLRTAVPADPGDPTGWPVWRQLLPHVLAASDPTRHLSDVVVDVGWLLHHAAGYLQARGEPRAARTLFKDAHDLYRRGLGDDHPDTLHSAHDLALRLGELGEHEGARELAADTLDRRRRVLGDDHPDTRRSVALLQRLGEQAVQGPQ